MDHCLKTLLFQTSLYEKQATGTGSVWLEYFRTRLHTFRFANIRVVPSLYRATSLETWFQSGGVLSLTAINTAGNPLANHCTQHTTGKTLSTHQNHPRGHWINLLRRLSLLGLVVWTSSVKSSSSPPLWLGAQLSRTNLRGTDFVSWLPGV